MQIQVILSQIDIGSYALPEFQRGYVWNREQVKKLMYSLYKGYPIGGLLTWVTGTNTDITRGDMQLQPGSVNLILDGQQRITSLYGIMNGKPPKFFEGNATAFTGLYFNISTEVFEFYAPLKMKDDVNWINVTELLQKGAGNYIQQSQDSQYLLSNIAKLNKIDNIKTTELHIQEVAGPDKTIDVVVEIFNNVNTGGTKLSKGDLALAKICAQWSDARITMRAILEKLSNAGYHFEMEWLLRCITVYLTKKPYFSELASVSIEDFKTGVKETEKLIGAILNQIGSRLGLDHDRVLGSRYSIPLMIGCLKMQGTKNLNNTDWNKLLYWYIHTFLWGRYAGSTESVLAQDLNILVDGKGIDGLISQLRSIRGDLTIKPVDFNAWSTGARFYPLLYLLTRVCQSKDWGNGIELKNLLLGKNSSLEVHHIFPKDLLYKKGYSKDKVNALANYTFLTKETNLTISNKEPKKYIPVCLEKYPGSVESHWIPADNLDLFELENYLKFLEERRELLAEKANLFLQSLLVSTEEIKIIDFANRQQPVQQEESEDDDLLKVLIWMEENQLDPGEINYQAVDDNGNLIVIINLAWPNGIQKGLSEKIALLLNESRETCSLVSSLGYKYFVDEEAFKNYISSTYLKL